MLDVRRREFITLIGGAVVSWPLAAWAQQPTPVIGYVSNWASDGIPRFAAGFRRGLKKPAWSKVATSQLNITRPGIKSIGGRRSWPTWWPAGSR